MSESPSPQRELEGGQFRQAWRWTCLFFLALLVLVLPWGYTLEGAEQSTFYTLAASVALGRLFRHVVLIPPWQDKRQESDMREEIVFLVNRFHISLKGLSHE